MFWILIGIITFFYLDLMVQLQSQYLGVDLNYYLNQCLNLIMKTLKRYGTTYYDMSMFGRTMLATSQPEMIRQVLIKNFNVFFERIRIPLLPQYLDQALIFVKVSSWKRIRSIVTPVFTSGKLKRIFKELDKPVNQSIQNFDYLIKTGRGNNVDIKKMCKYYSVDIIAKIVFASEFDSFKQNHDEFLKQVLELVNPKIFSFILTNILPYWMLKALGISLFNDEAKDYFVNKSIQLIEYRKQNPNIQYNDFLQILLELETENETNLEWKQINREEIIGQLLVFFFAGMETVSSTLSNMLYEIAINPEWQEKLYEEIMQYHPDDKLDYDDLNKSKLLDLFIKEVLRMHASLARIFRTVSEDFEFQNGIRIKKGTTVMVPIWTLHHNPDMWDEPFKFNPLRFENIDFESCSYIPFGDGGRRCVGERFALIEVKYFLIKFIKTYQVYKVATTDIPPKFKNAVLILSYDHMYLGIKPRQ